MTEEERRLAAALKRSVPPPPMTISAADVARLVEPNRRRAATGWLPATAAACVLALVAALGVAAVRHYAFDDSRATPAAGPPEHSTVQPAPTGSGRAGTTVGPWSAHALTRSPVAATLVGGPGSGYAITGDQVERYDPAAGAVLAQAPVTAIAAGPLVVTASALWQAQVGGGTLSLLPRDLTTLRARTPVVVATNVGQDSGQQPQLVSDPTANRLILRYGNEIYGIDPADGSVTAHATAGGPVGALAPSADGRHVFVAVNPAGTGTSQLLTFTSGDLSTARQDPIGPGPVTGLLATANGVWTTVTGGHFDSVQYRALTDLAQSRTVSSGGGGLPSTVTLAAGAVWIAGPNTLTCADPATGLARASTAVTLTAGQPRYFAAVTRVGADWLASYASGGTGGIAAFTPPKECLP